MNIVILILIVVVVVSLLAPGTQGSTGGGKSQTGVVRVTCDGINPDELDDDSMTIFAQSLESSYGDDNYNDNTMKHGTFVKVHWACSICRDDDKSKRRHRPPSLVGEDEEDYDIDEEEDDDEAVNDTMEFDVNWICGDLCPDDNFVVSSFTDYFVQAYNGLRGAMGTRTGDSKVVEWEKNLINTLINTNSTTEAFRTVETCTIKVKLDVVNQHSVE
jgi:hypothetical protein